MNGSIEPRQIDLHCALFLVLWCAEMFFSALILRNNNMHSHGPTQIIYYSYTFKFNILSIKLTFDQMLTFVVYDLHAKLFMP